MSVLTKTKTSFPAVAGDFFEGERFLRSGLLNFNSDFFTLGLSSRLPGVNIRETDKDFLLELAAPGLERGDFRVEMENGMLTVSVEKDEELEEKNEHYKRREFFYESFCRSFTLPQNLLKEKINAQYENGILKVWLPKKEVSEFKPKKEIKVS